MKRLVTFMAGAAIGAVLAMLVASLLSRPDPLIPEPPAPAIELPSGGLVAERLPPPAVLPEVAKEAAAATGGKPVRVGQAVVEPARSTMGAVEPDPDTGAPLCVCRPAPITVDWSLIQTRDGHRVAFATDDGVILSATDRPLVLTRREPKWAAGVTFSMDADQRRSVGAFVDRDVGRMRLGLEISQRDGGAATAKVGWRW